MLMSIENSNNQKCCSLSNTASLILVLTAKKYTLIEAKCVHERTHILVWTNQLFILTKFDASWSCWCQRIKMLIFRYIEQCMLPHISRFQGLIFFFVCAFSLVHYMLLYINLSMLLRYFYRREKKTDYSQINQRVLISLPQI